MYYFDKEKELEKYIEIANQFDAGCTKESVIGVGTYGVCFKRNEIEALKITCDLSEVCVAITALKGDYNSMAEIKSIDRSINPDLWLIKQELCDELSPKDKRTLDRLLEELDYYDEIHEMGTAKGLIALFDNGELEHFEADELIEELIEAVKDASRCPLLRELDLHEGNIMRSNGKITLIDMKDVNLSDDRVILQKKMINKYELAKEDMNDKNDKLAYSYP